ncbi:MAG: hypothetical protein WC139_12900 [Candidatus Kapaibacterium sp.]
MSLEIKINGVRVNIPDKQTIAYNLSNFEITSLANRKLNYTNSFQIPREGNELVFGFASDPTTAQTVPYAALSIDVTVDGFKIISDGSAFIESFEDGKYNVQITDNKDEINAMKAQSLKTMYSGDSILINDAAASTVEFQDFLVSTTGFRFDIIMNDLHIAEAAAPEEYIWDTDSDNISVFVKTVFEKYATDNGITFAGDLWIDTYFEELRMLCYYCTIHYSSGDHYLTNIQIDKTHSFHDLLIAVLQIFGATYKISGTTITLSKLDNFSLTTYVDLSGKTIKVNKKTFTIPGTGQKNHLRYKTGDNADKDMNQTVIDSNNLNTPYDVDLINYDAKVFPLLLLDMYSGYTDEYSIYIKNNTGKYSGATDFDRPLTDFVFLRDSTEVYFAGVDISWTDDRKSLVTYTNVLSVPLCTYFNSASEYAVLADMLYNPVFYEVEMQLNIFDIFYFDNLKFVFIKELGGLFYVNSIKDYLLNSDDKSATVELIKINSAP